MIRRQRGARREKPGGGTEKREQVLRALAQGKRNIDAAKEYGVPAPTVNTWKRKAMETGEWEQMCAEGKMSVLGTAKPLPLGVPLAAGEMAQARELAPEAAAAWQAELKAQHKAPMTNPNMPPVEYEVPRALLPACSEGESIEQVVRKCVHDWQQLREMLPKTARQDEVERSAVWLEGLLMGLEMRGK